MEKKNIYDAIIIGGGASGLMCAITAKKHDRSKKIAIIEKNDRLGKKLMSTGNGRCNLTNHCISPDKYVGSFKKQSKKIFERFSGDEMANIFKNFGLLSFYDNEGRYYPISKHAASVLDVLRLQVQTLGIDVFTKQNVNSIKQVSNGFKISSDDSEEKYDFICNKLVIANGSKAAPKLGGNASAIDYLKNFGHKVVSFSPALCPVKVKSDVLKILKGLRVTGKAQLYGEHGRLIKEETGEIQFTENSLSGICVFNLSLFAKPNDKIVLDLLPDYSENELIKIIRQHISLFSDLPCEQLLTGIFQKRIGQAILKISRVDLSKICSKLSKDEVSGICKTIKSMSFTVSGKEDFSHAQCALGGVLGKEIDENTMMSKIVKNLFICGEAIDLCGECGGFNLHFAFAGGIIAGENL